MANKMLKPYSWALYFLTVFALFFAGLNYAGTIEAGKDQGLAGGAIVLGYGVAGAGIGLFIALIAANRFSRRTIIISNIILLIFIAVLYIYFHFKFLSR